MPTGRILRKAILSMSFWVCAGGLATPGLPGQGARDPQAVELLRRAAAAMGLQGKEISSVSARGVFTDRSGERAREWRFAVLADGPDRVRWERSDGDRTIVTVVFGDFGWMRDGGAPPGRLSLSRTAGRSIEALPLAALKAWIEAPDRRAALLPPEQSGGRMLNRVQVGPFRDADARPGLARAVERSRRKELLLDPRTGRLERLRYFRHPGDWRQDIPVELAFSDLRTVQGVLWPHRVAVEAGGRIAGKYAFERVEFNLEIDPRVFEEPEE